MRLRVRKPPARPPAKTRRREKIRPLAAAENREHAQEERDKREWETEVAGGKRKKTAREGEKERTETESTQAARRSEQAIKRRSRRRKAEVLSNKAKWCGRERGDCSGKATLRNAVRGGCACRRDGLAPKAASLAGGIPVLRESGTFAGKEGAVRRSTVLHEAAHDVQQFGSYGLLPRLVVSERELFDKLVGVVGRHLHGYHAGGVFCSKAV